MEDTSFSNSSLDFFLKCFTLFDQCEESPVTIDGIISGRQIARLLVQITTISHDESEFWKIADAEKDDEFPNLEANWRILKPKLMGLFNSNEYDVSVLNLWQFDIPDIIRGKHDAILRLLVYLATGTAHSEGHARLKMEKIITDFSDVERNNIVTQMNSLHKLILRQNGKQLSLDEITKQHNARITEISQSKDKLIKENDELVSQINELRQQLILTRVDAEKMAVLKAKLTETELKLKYSENMINSMKNDNFVNQKLFQEQDFKISKLEMVLESKEGSLQNLQTKMTNLHDECETLRSNESQLQRKLKNYEFNRKSSGSEAMALIQKNKEIELLNQRIEDYVKQLAEKDSLKTKIVSLDQMLSNEKMQREETGEELTKAINRANEAEFQVICLQQQVRREQSSRSDDLTNSFSSNQGISLQDELSNSNISFNLSNFDIGLKDFTEWKSKCESLEAQNHSLLSELRNTKTLNESTHSDYTSQIQKERNQAEKIKQEQMSLTKQVYELEQRVVSLTEENKLMIKEKYELESMIEYNEKCLQNAADVIRVYSDCGPYSSAENLKLRTEKERLQKELDAIKLKIDQFKHESCQEQRLISNHWYQRAMNDCRHKTIASNPIILSPSLSNSEGSKKNVRESFPTRQKTFIEKQLETSEFTASSSSRVLSRTDNDLVVIGGVMESNDNKISKSVNAFKRSFTWKFIPMVFFICFVVFSIIAVLNYEFCILTSLTHSTCTLLGKMPEFKTDYLRHHSTLLSTA